MNWLDRTSFTAALTRLLTEEEAYLLRDLTLLGRERPADVFDTTRALFVQRFELTVHRGSPVLTALAV